MLGMYFKNTFQTAKATKNFHNNLQQNTTEEFEAKFPFQFSGVTGFITDEGQGMRSPGH